MGILRENSIDGLGIQAGTNYPKYGSYRYIPLNEIIDSFAATYVGKGKLCENVVLNDVNFHAIRALQELSYDTLKSVKSWEVTVPSTLVHVMPVDYINYVKLSWSDSNGIERIIYPAVKTSNPKKVKDAASNHGGYDNDTNGLIFQYGIKEQTRSEDSNNFSATRDKYVSNSASDIGSVDADNINDEYGNLVGGRYGIDPQHAQANGSFYIDEDKGKFHFSSNISGKTVIIKYLSDGISASRLSMEENNAGNSEDIDLTNSLVPKLAEEAIYKHILYGVLSARRDTPAGVLGLIKKERFAETRKAKLRLSNIKLEELTQILRGGSKQIKH